MREAGESKQRAATDVDERRVNERGVAHGTERTDVVWLDAAELLAITPEEVQLLAATGC